MTEFLLEVGLKSLPLAGLGLALAWIMKNKSASARFTVLAAIFAVLAVLPLAVVLSPKVAVIERPIQATPVELRQTSSSSGTVWVAPAETSGMTAEVIKPRVTAQQAVLLLWLLGAFACWTSLARDILSGLKSVPSTTRRGTSISWSREDAFGPFVWGWLRPKVVLPSALKTMEGSVRSALIAHEMAHVQRGDWPLRIAFRMIRGLYWFNPLVWLLEKRAAMESEIACDDLVVTAGTDPARYAEGLLEVAKMQRLSTAPGASSPRLKTRLVALFDKTRDRSQAGRSIKIAALLTAIAGLGAIAPLSVGSEAPVEKTFVPEALRETAQSSLNQMPAKAVAQKGTLNKVQGKGTSNRGQAPSSVYKGSAGVNRAGQAPAAQGGGTGGSAVNGVSGQSPAGFGGQGDGAVATVNGQSPAGSGGQGGGAVATVNDQSPAGFGGQGGGASATVNGQSPAGFGGQGGGASATANGQAPAGLAQSGSGSRAAYGGQGVNRASGGGGFEHGASVSTGGRGRLDSVEPGAEGNSVSAATSTDEPFGTQILDSGNGWYHVTHVTKHGKFTAQGRNIELYENGVLIVKKKLGSEEKPVRHMAGFVTNEMAGRGSLAFVKPDAP